MDRPLAKMLHETGEFLDLRKAGLDHLSDVVRVGGVLYWNRHGLIGKIPSSVIRNAMELWFASDVPPLVDWAQVQQESW